MEKKMKKTSIIILTGIFLLLSTTAQASRQHGACQIADVYCSDQLKICEFDCQEEFGTCVRDSLGGLQQCSSRCPRGYWGLTCQFNCFEEWTVRLDECNPECRSTCRSGYQNCLDDEVGSCDGSLACENACTGGQQECIQEVEQDFATCEENCPPIINIGQCQSACYQTCSRGWRGWGCKYNCRRECSNSDGIRCSNECRTTRNQGISQCEVDGDPCQEECLIPFQHCTDQRNECLDTAHNIFETCKRGCSGRWNQWLGCQYNCFMSNRDSENNCHIDSFTCLNTMLADRDQDSHTPYQGDCDDNDNTIYPSATDVCDGKDNNCDGSTDEDFLTEPTTCGVGECTADGQLVCVEGIVQNTCGPGTPTDEFCDGLDNNCDGIIDDNIPSEITTCGTGECLVEGELICVNGTMQDTCEPGTPTDEVCDGLDNNCDGQIDDNIPATPTTCGIGECFAGGELICVDGAIYNTCVPGSPASELCDGVDNNCDGIIDDNIPTESTTCGAGECLAEGELVCTDGTMQDTCKPGHPTDELCDGLDNNCDGEIDDNISSETTTCGVGECFAEGVLECVDGVMQGTCEPGPPTDELCDGLDNNCDGMVDNSIPSEPTECGVGECFSEGELICATGAIHDTCEPGTPIDEVCGDGVDNNCNGVIDEDCLDLICEDLDQSVTYVDNGYAPDCGGVPVPMMLRLVDSQCNPLERAGIQILDENDNMIIYHRTDPDGWADFTDYDGTQIPVRFLVHYNGGAYTTVPGSFDTGSLVQTQFFQLTMVGGDCEPVERAHINLRTASEDYITYTRTDANGIAGFEILPDNEMRMQVEYNGGTWLSDALTANMDIILGAERFELLLLNSEGNPFENVHVNIRDLDDQQLMYTRTDDEGIALFDVLPEVEVKLQAHLYHTRYDTPYSVTHEQQHVQTLLFGVDFSDSYGTPIADEHIDLKDSDNTYYDYRYTSPEGIGAFEVLPSSEFKLVILYNRTEYSTEVMSIWENTLLPISTVPLTAHVTVDGAPLVNHKVDLFNLDDIFIRYIRTDTNGLSEFQVLPEAEHRMRVIYRTNTFLETVVGPDFIEIPFFR